MLLTNNNSNVPYEINGLLKGKYIIYVVSSKYKMAYWTGNDNDPSTSEDDAVLINCTDTSKTEINVVISKGATISGTITNENDNPIYSLPGIVLKMQVKSNLEF